MVSHRFSPSARRAASVVGAALVIALLAPRAAQAEQLPPTMGILIRALAKNDDPSAQLNILRGINAALKGKRNLPAPEGWEALYAKLSASQNQELREQAQALAVVFGGGSALDEFRKTLGDAAAPMDRRKNALESLLSARDAAAEPLLIGLLAEASPLRKPAIHGLAAYDDPKIPEAILRQYGSYNSEEKREALSTLVSRPAWARSIIQALDSKVIARSDVSTPIARQLSELNDPRITEWLAKNWGAMRSSSADKQQQIARLKSVLTPSFMVRGDPSHGRALFSQTCALCHTLFGAGAKIGPELPGAFEDIDYLLLNIIDPNAIIGKDYQQTVVETKDGQTLVGIIGEQDATSLTLKSLAGLQTVQKGDIAKVTVLDTSLMPEGLLSALKDEDVRDLFSYLRLHGQVPVLANALNANDFFDGADLNRWIPSRADAWHVENGEIVGKGNAQRPEFLTSDMVAEKFRFTAMVKLTGDDASAEVRYIGSETDGGFQGSAIRLEKGRAALLQFSDPGKERQAGTLDVNLPLAQWFTCEVVQDGAKLRVSLNGQQVVDSESKAGERAVIAFGVSGAGSELRVKSPKLEVMQ